MGQGKGFALVRRVNRALHWAPTRPTPLNCSQPLLAPHPSWRGTCVTGLRRSALAFRSHSTYHRCEWELPCVREKNFYLVPSPMCARADWPGLDDAILPPPYQTLILLDSKSGSSCHNNNNNNIHVFTHLRFVINLLLIFYSTFSLTTVPAHPSWQLQKFHCPWRVVNYTH